MDGGGCCSGGSFKLYEELELQEFQDKFMIKSVAAPDRGFSSDRRDGTIEPFSGDSSSSSPSPSKTSRIYVVAGTIRVLTGQLSTAFSAEMQNLPNVRYVSLDFHQVCGNSNFENLKVLYEQISEQFEKQGYFPIDAKGNILEEQKGIVRSNCIGCLDRTNVTQSYLAQKSLDAQLQRTGVLDSSESISVFVEDYQTFKPCMEFFVSCILSFINDQTMSTINI
ncbi:hypothetical protein ACFX1T_009841 [Malus domestica]